MATTIDRTATEAIDQAPRKPSSGPGRGLVVLAGVALAAVAAATVLFFWPAQHQKAPVASTNTQNSLYTQNELTTMRLVAGGLVPPETLHGGIYRIKSLINQGLIPRETLNEYQPPVEPLYTPRELRIIMLVNAGILPKETLDGEPFRTKALANAGYIPRAAAFPARDSGQ